VTFLLDTNAISEWVKPRPNPGLVAWIEGVDEDQIFISAITLAELRYGVDRLAAGAKRSRLDRWLGEDLPLRFEGRVLPVDGSVADACGRIFARCEIAGRRMEAMDAFIAATAEVHHLTLVTRDAADFRVALRAVHNPWT
jgi:toxin FitB